MNTSKQIPEREDTTAKVLAFVCIFGLTLSVAIWSGIAKQLPGVEWRSFQRLWTTTVRAPEITHGEKTYTARPGDTLSGIVDRYGIALSELVSLNGIEDPDELRVGQILLIAEAIRSGPEPSPPSLASELPLEPELLAKAGGEDRGEARVGRFERFATVLHQLVRGLRLDTLFRRPENTAVAPEPSAAALAALPAEAPVPTANLPASDFRAVDEVLAMAEEELYSARFEDALKTAEIALRLLESDPDSTEARQRRVRLELVRANVHSAFGSSSDARRCIERALQADPDLVLDAARTSPKLLHAFRSPAS
jgi:LysM repeat protein